MSDSHIPATGNTSPQHEALRDLLTGLPEERQAAIMSLFDEQDALRRNLEQWLDTYGAALAGLEDVQLALMEDEVLTCIERFLKLAEAYRLTDNKPGDEQLALLKPRVKELLNSSSASTNARKIVAMLINGNTDRLTEAINELRNLLGDRIPTEDDEHDAAAKSRRAQLTHQFGALAFGTTSRAGDTTDGGDTHSTACVD